MECSSYFICRLHSAWSWQSVSTLAISFLFSFFLYFVVSNRMHCYCCHSAPLWRIRSDPGVVVAVVSFFLFSRRCAAKIKNIKILLYADEIMNVTWNKNTGHLFGCSSAQFGLRLFVIYFAFWLNTVCVCCALPISVYNWYTIWATRCYIFWLCVSFFVCWRWFGKCYDAFIVSDVHLYSWKIC